MKISSFVKLRDLGLVYTLEELNVILEKKSRPAYYNGARPVVCSIHSLDSWNTRVGPVLSYEKLNFLMGELVRLTDRIERINGGRLIIDDDIVAGYVYSNREIVITTFFGRLSLHPGLRGNLERDLLRLNLQLEDGELQNQRLPIIPRFRIDFFVSSQNRPNIVEVYPTDVGYAYFLYAGIGTNFRVTRYIAERDDLTGAMNAKFFKKSSDFVNKHESDSEVKQ